MPRMKLLPCRPADERPPGPDCARIGYALDERQQPALSARPVAWYKCHRCRRPTRLTAAQYNRLPRLTVDEVERRAERSREWRPVLEMFLRDFVGAGHTREQAKDLVRYGFVGPNEQELQ